MIDDKKLFEKKKHRILLQLDAIDYSTKLAQLSESKFSLVMNDYIEIIKKIILDNRGTIFVYPDHSGSGDCLKAVFDDGDDSQAYNAAKQIIIEVALRNQMRLEDSQLYFRLALHSEKFDYSSKAMALTQLERLEKEASKNEIIISDSFYEENQNFIHGSVQEETKELKGLSEIKFHRNYIDIPLPVTEMTNITPVQTPKIQKQNKKRVAILVATPIDKPLNATSPDIIKALSSFDIDLEYFIFTDDILYTLNDFDIVLILSKIHKQSIIIENEFFISRIIPINEILDILSASQTKLVVLLTENQSEDIIHISKIPFIYATLDLKVLKSQLFKLFFQIKLPDSYTPYNIDEKQLSYFKLNKGKAHLLISTTELPDELDDKHLKDFVGRKTATKNVIEKILTVKDQGSFLTIKGPGGFGKTTLVLKCLYEISQRNLFRDGIYFIACEPILSYELFEQKISNAFELDNALNFQSQLHTKGDTDRVVILDNFETLLYISESKKVIDLVRYISRYATIIVTTREVLNKTIDNSWEDVYELQKLSSFSAVDLFRKYVNFRKEEETFLKNEILENLLDNNPLAIKLVGNNVTSNIPLDVLKNELEKSFFSVTSEEVEEVFDREKDLNIEKSRSLFHTIQYSYRQLGVNEKLFFEILSLFPSGIQIQNFKQFVTHLHKKYITSGLTEKTIKSLERKSLFSISKNKIHMQSITNRFAHYMFTKKTEEEKDRYYDIVFDYNDFYLNQIEQLWVDEKYHAIMMFDRNRENLTLVLDFLDRKKFICQQTLMYIDLLCELFSLYARPDQQVIKKIIRLIPFFSQIPFATELIQSNILALRYYFGEFQEVFQEIEETFPLEKVFALDNEDSIQNLIYRNISSIYTMEGYCYDVLEHENSSKSSWADFFLVGQYKTCLNLYEIKKKTIIGKFFYFEYLLNCNVDFIDELKKYLETLYETEFLEKIHCFYTLSKKENVQKEQINRLVHTNPFAYGLKRVMYAFIENDPIKKQKHFLSALANVEHIKYYYVEIMYFYAKFLKSIQHDDYESVYTKGYELAKQHYYHFLLHQYVNLKNNSNDVYNEDNYPLPTKLCITI